MLRGETVYLRALEPEDLDLLYTWENDTDLWQVSNTLVPFSRKLLKEYLEQTQLDIYASKQLRMVICLNNEKAIGFIDLFDFDPSNLRAGIGILIGDKTERNQGHAADALKTLQVYCKEKLNLHQLYCSIAADNIASRTLFEKNNFVSTGLKKDWQRSGASFIDEYFFQCIL